MFCSFGPHSHNKSRIWDYHSQGTQRSRILYFVLLPEEGNTAVVRNNLAGKLEQWTVSKTSVELIAMYCRQKSEDTVSAFFFFTVAARSMTWTVFARSNTGIVGSRQEPYQHGDRLSILCGIVIGGLRVICRQIFAKCTTVMKSISRGHIPEECLLKWLQLSICTHVRTR
jgi:hypothetical protein